MLGPRYFSERYSESIRMVVLAMLESFTDHAARLYSISKGEILRWSLSVDLVNALKGARGRSWLNSWKE